MRTWGSNLEIHLVGHSAGAIFLGHLVDLLAVRELKGRIGSLHLYAPACTVQFANRLKLAQIEKLQAEGRRLNKETEVFGSRTNSELWSDVIKIIGGVLLGIGGVTAAYPQYEVSQLKAKIAEEEMSKAELAKSAAEKTKTDAEAVPKILLWQCDHSSLTKVVHLTCALSR
ncbi:hypothetical protein D3C77_496910 [compost metagenome]